MTASQSDAEAEPTPKLDDALDVILDEYGDTYPEWGRFAHDAQAHADANGYATEWGDPHVHMSVVRYRLRGSDLCAQPEIDGEHVDHLIAFAGDGCPSARP